MPDAIVRTDVKNWSHVRICAQKMVRLLRWKWPTDDVRENISVKTPQNVMWDQQGSGQSSCQQFGIYATDTCGKHSNDFSWWFLDGIVHKTINEVNSTDSQNWYLGPQRYGMSELMPNALSDAMSTTSLGSHVSDLSMNICNAERECHTRTL